MFQSDFCRKCVGDVFSVGPWRICSRCFPQLCPSFGVLGWPLTSAGPGVLCVHTPPGRASSFRAHARAGAALAHSTQTRTDRRVCLRSLLLLACRTLRESLMTPLLAQRPAQAADRAPVPAAKGRRGPARNRRRRREKVVDDRGDQIGWPAARLDEQACACGFTVSDASRRKQTSYARCTWAQQRGSGMEAHRCKACQ